MNCYNIYSTDFRYHMHLIIYHPYHETILFNTFIDGEYVYYNSSGPSGITIDIEKQKILYTFTDKSGTDINIKKAPNNVFMNICKWEIMSNKKKLDYYTTFRNYFIDQMSNQEIHFNYLID